MILYLLHSIRTNAYTFFAKLSPTHYHFNSLFKEIVLLSNQLDPFLYCTVNKIPFTYYLSQDFNSDHKKLNISTYCTIQFQEAISTQQDN